MTGMAAAAKITAADLPENVRHMPAQQQLGWLDSSEACAVFPGRKTRHKLRAIVLAQVALLDRQRRDGVPVAMPRTVARVERRLEYPHLYANERSRLFHDRPCACVKCVGKLWPYPHAGSIGPGEGDYVSYECYVLEREFAAVEPRKMTEADAVREGLTIKDSQAGEWSLAPLVPGCERCGADRRKGDRYCAVCNKAMRKEMLRAGYLQNILRH